jgi:alkanesulfonate monooxygenase SsuD/methylene tetrahydromethanopterin reductase-like flavin-dependent oxidoreductase (luciferase family)
VPASRARTRLQGQAVVGSPASVADRLGELYDDLGGFGQIIGLFAIGPSTHEQVKRSAELFATEVMPVLRPLGTKTATVPDAREGGR